MADKAMDYLPELGACPSSPRPDQARVLVVHNDHNANTANYEEATALHPRLPVSAILDLWTHTDHSGFEHLRSHPPARIANQIPPAGTVFGTESHPPPDAIFGAQPPYPTEIFHSRVRPAGTIFGSLSPPDAVVFSNNPPPGALLGNQTSSPATDSGKKFKDFSKYLPHPMHKCFALTSTRVYNESLRCDRCGGRSEFGWYYRCCHETDARLFESISNGNEEHFDEIGRILTQNIQQPNRGPAARQDKLSPLNELPADQLESLCASQLARVLRQHEAAINTALADRHGPSVPPAEDKPFLTPQAEECRISLCPRCGRAGAGEQQSFLSLDGALKGDVPPSTAVGFGFRALGGRPVANANIVKRLGLRDPKTGLLPGQEAKNTGAQSAMGGSGSGAERTIALNVDDSETSDVSEGPKTPDGSLKTSDSDEDLVQLYMDSEEEARQQYSQ